MYLLWFLMIPTCLADPSILLISGSGYYTGGVEVEKELTVEEFNPINMTSKIIAKYKWNENNDNNEFEPEVQAAPVNSTHAIVIAPWKDPMDGRSHYIDRNGAVSPGPRTQESTQTIQWVKENKGDRINLENNIVSLCEANGRRRVIICGGDQDQFLADDGRSFKYHSEMNMMQVFTLTAFGNELIAVGWQYYGQTDNSRSKRATQRYDGGEWNTVARQPEDATGSVAVKLNDDQLLSCGGTRRRNKKKTCYIYNLANDTWVDGPGTKLDVSWGEMVMVGKTVFAFGGEGGENRIQTLDVSNGTEKAAWKLESAKMKAGRARFGVWVVDGPQDECPITATDEPTAVTTSKSTVTGSHLFGMVLALLVSV